MSHSPRTAIDLTVSKAETGEIESVRIRFGPHFIVEVRDDGKAVQFKLVATHHGFTADASQVGGQLEGIIEGVRSAHPDALVG